MAATEPQQGRGAEQLNLWPFERLSQLPKRTTDIVGVRSRHDECNKM